MQIISNSKSLFTGALLLLMIACNPGSSKDKGSANDKPAKDNLRTLPPETADNAAGQDTVQGIKKCFMNDGLNNKTVVTLLFGNKNGKEIVSGNVTSEELGSGKTEMGVFEGTSDGDQLMIKFVGNPPTAGDASEWTDKPWTIKKSGEKETLLIVFNAKNYETNKWNEAAYKFEKSECK